MAEAGVGSCELCIVPPTRPETKTKRRHRPWTVAEDRILREHHPDYLKLHELLPDRGLPAIKVRCCKLRITEQYMRWSREDVKLLEKNYHLKRWADLLKIFPGRSQGSIRGMAIILGLRRSSVEQPPTGVDLLDEIRDRARRSGITLKHLDELSGSGLYFQRNRKPKFIQMDYIERAIKALNGQLIVVWED